MSTFSRWLLLAITVASVGAAQVVADDIRRDLGQSVDKAEIAELSITIFPDGRGLPDGQGSVAEGASLYVEQCAHCHGKTGTEGPAVRLSGPEGLLPGLESPLLSMSVGSRWPYATTVFDFVRRAMSHSALKSLTNAEVYPLTAYILHLNELIDGDAVLNQSNLPQVRMPALTLGDHDVDGKGYGRERLSRPE